MDFESVKLSESQKRNAKIIYLAISLALFIWINIEMHTPGSEAAIPIFILITIFTVPISLVLTWLLNIFEPTIPSNLLVFTFLLAGYLQFFHFIPWFTKIFTGNK